MLFDLARSLRSLTQLSPITTAVNEARRMARHHFEHGGAAASGRNGDQTSQRDFPLPSDIDVVELSGRLIRS